MSVAMALAKKVLLAALAYAPIETRPQYAGYAETREQALDRYWSIAQDIAEAAVEVPPKPGGMSDEQEAALLLALAIGESGLSLDVDRGPCYRKGKLWRRCDSGTSFTIWQLKPSLFDGKVRTGRELQADRKLAARVALHRARGSIGQCRALPAVDRLSAYGSGRCIEGLQDVQARWRLAVKVREFMRPLQGEVTQ